jgi:sterol desaturase/sphingolipid hydroxylase (fatty acid hydroxylase superfamily)
MARTKPISPVVTGAIILGTFAVIAYAESRRPLRRQRHDTVRRNLRNLAMAGITAATMSLLEKPVVDRVSRAVERRRWGLLQQVRLPRLVENVLAVALMDYTLYLWHVLTHRVPALWRFHAVHHVDLDLDASTALRFHFTEMAISVPYRTAQIALIGVGPRALSIWQTFLFVSILFHHSNLRLPSWLERRLSKIIVTPRMHGIHHSIVEEEVNSNWSSGLTMWDWLHGTLRKDVPQSEIDIGVPAYRHESEVTLPNIIRMPFGRQRRTDVLPDGTTPTRRRIARRSK